MTYPPQQPGPYGQQPEQYGPPPYTQQPSPGFGQHGYPGPGGHGGYPGGPGGEPPGRRSTGMIITVAVVAILVLAAAAVLIYVLTKDDSGGSAASTQSTGAKPAPGTASGAPRSDASSQPAPPGNPESGGDADIVKVAQAYAEAVNTRQEVAAKELTCDKTDPGVLYQSTTSGQKVEVTGKPEMSGNDSAFIDFGVSTSGTDPIDIPILMENNGGWCIAI